MLIIKLKLNPLKEFIFKMKNQGKDFLSEDQEKKLSKRININFLINTPL